IFVAVIFLDLLFFSRQIIPQVTWERKNIPFNEGVNPFRFFNQRKTQESFNDEFRYFRPALIGRPSAYDSIRFIHYDSKNSQVDVGAVIENIKTGKTKFFDRLISTSLYEFVLEQALDYDSWPKEKRKEFLNIIELSIDGVFLENFYGDYNNSRFMTEVKDYPYLHVLRSNLFNVYNNTDYSWPDKGSFLNRWKNIFDLKIEASPTDQGAIIFNRNLSKLSSFYKKIPAASSLIFIYNRSHFSNVNSFVRLKGFEVLDSIIRSSVLSSDYPRIYSRILDDLGINLPIIRFYQNIETYAGKGYYDILASGRFKPGVLYIESDQDLLFRQDKDRKRIEVPNSRYEINSYNPNRLELFYRNEEDSFLYFSDSYHKDWKASIDGKTTLIYRANGYFKAIKAPKGEHQVVFRYDPVFYRVSLYFYYLISLGCLVYLIKQSSWFRKR
ncbi:MAG: YfhO family protein, partial [Candidatus Omnitrophica bacterium]|nr:YfhO family protein [Candidatus Omnitrophota bacterium]